jgi:flagellar hook protein FlgE
MAIHYALFSGVSGLAVNTDSMGVISNNIANSNTRAFKADRAEFEDLLAVNLNEFSQLGRGVRLRSITTNFTQGALSHTGGITDMAIQGEGFFVMRTGGADMGSSGTRTYTRQGTFRFDRDGYISDVHGQKLQGFLADADGKLETRMQDMQVSTTSITPVPTTKVTMNVNLDLREPVLIEEFDPRKPNETSNYATTVTMYDNFGQSHQATVYFAKDKDEINSWNWYATIDGSEIKGAQPYDELGQPLPHVIGNGKISFDENGKPIMNFRTKEGKPSFIDVMEQSDAHEIQFANGSAPQKVQFNFGAMEDELGKVGKTTSTSLATRSSTLYHSQNGSEAGYLKSLKIDQEGNLRAVYTNGLERRLGAIALATFPSPAGLQKTGQNCYGQTYRSGEPSVGIPQTGTRGSVYSASLEESNVDLASQFVDMITTQRGFQANSKTITTSDSMLEEIIGLKR